MPYSETVIESGDERIRVGIDRAYVRRGEQAAKTGPWQVELSNVSNYSSGIRFNAGMAKEIADAILQHSAECDRRNGSK